MRRWHELYQMLTERRIGFRIDEVMRGTHRYLRDFLPGDVPAGAEFPLEFFVTWGNPHLEKFLNPFSGDFFFSDLEGTLSAGGLCLEAPVKGSFELNYFKDATLRYCFEFTAYDRLYRYLGEKRGIRPWNLQRTHTTCYGTITDVLSGEILSESVVYFDLPQLPSFLASLRLA
jgi:hypothetical protein